MADALETSFDPNNTENNDDMEVVTMVDVLKEQQELQDDADAVLGGSDEKNCTYSKGYLKRQALYACVTCIPEAKTNPLKRSGICLACSYHCHEGHDLIELYTKRNFRCDCGNQKFPEHKCNLEPEKSAVNDLNTYNHNFSGFYCTCERPYPDPEDKVIDDMIQCIVCEDWYHCRHLGSTNPSLTTYSEMICSGCIGKHEFLLNYSALAVSKIKSEDDSTSNESELITVESDATRPVDAPLGVGQVLNKTDLDACKMPPRKSDLITAKFWPENWRSHLCTCKSCMDVYETDKISYLIDNQDTVHFYEEKGKAKALAEPGETEYEQGLKALSSLDRVKQVEAITEYNTMKEQLKEYLKKFADNKKIVREEDIREFFSSLSARKKQRTEVPYFCR